MSKRGCINPASVPCEKARAYLSKKGLLCDDTPKQPKKPKTKGFFEEWFR